MKTQSDKNKLWRKDKEPLSTRSKDVGAKKRRVWEEDSDEESDQEESRKRVRRKEAGEKDKSSGKGRAEGSGNKQKRSGNRKENVPRKEKCRKERDDDGKEDAPRKEKHQRERDDNRKEDAPQKEKRRPEQDNDDNPRPSKVNKTSSKASKKLSDKTSSSSGGTFASSSTSQSSDAGLSKCQQVRKKLEALAHARTSKVSSKLPPSMRRSGPPTVCSGDSDWERRMDPDAEEDKDDEE
ncbi:hypothetical protein B0H17DRAFT_1217168 [Mycena rosella]|uniref:Uncharacterized protein n=1 Tax=Mycena rosella TaxID=1033263 RepID=A0AAD7C0Q7_MYCRO|nr:hypothetical protein B0H17DRAFT_1217168 [Mycena rosella]